jgi:hypothetical protein
MSELTHLWSGGSRGGLPGGIQYDGDLLIEVV